MQDHSPVAIIESAANYTRDGWPDPLLFNEAHAIPLSSHILPDNIGCFVRELADATETPEDMAVACCLGVLSTAVAGKYCVSPKEGWYESLNTYWSIELPPANRKSAVVRACTEPLVQWERKQNAAISEERERASSLRKNEEKRIEKMRKKATDMQDADERAALYEEIQRVEAALPEIPIPARTFANNITPESLEQYVDEQRNVFAVISDEGGVVETLTGLYNSSGRANVDILLKGIDGGDMRIKRKDRESYLNPLLTFVLCVQPIVRERMRNNMNLQGNGAIERFLYVLPHSYIGSRTHDTKPVSADAKKRYGDTIERLLDIPREYDNSRRLMPHILRLSDAAYTEFHAFELWLEPQLKPHATLHYLQGWAGKIGGYIIRIAGLLHLAAGKDERHDIDETTMVNAICMGKELIHHACRVYQLMGQDEATCYAEKIYDWLIYHGQYLVTRSQVTTAMRHMLKASQITTGMAELERRHIVQMHQEPASGAKPTTYYEVNPKLFVE